MGRGAARAAALVAAVALSACFSTSAPAEPTPPLLRDPFPEPIEALEGVIPVRFREFASVPDLRGVPAKMMLIEEQPGTGRFVVNDMRGPLWVISRDGAKVERYLDLADARWGLEIPQIGTELGIQSFAFHPEFARRGAPGYGKLYTWGDTNDTLHTPDFETPGPRRSHDTVLLEWTVRDAASATYDGGPPRELMRFKQPYPIHNGGRLAFNPLARPGDADFGLLYMGVSDGGEGLDPYDSAQNLASGFGKILRFDPLGTNSANGRYGIPADNPFVADGDPRTLGEIYAYGLRNPQNFAWDRATGRMYTTDIGQETIEEVSPVTPGANLGWDRWEGSFPFGGMLGVGVGTPRADPAVTYPAVEYAQLDPLLQWPSAAATGLVVYRDGPIATLRDKLLFGDLPSGEIFWVPADDPPLGGQDRIRRVLLLDERGELKTLLELVRAKNREQRRPPSFRTDLRLHPGPDGTVFVLNKRDGTIRLLVP